MCYGSGVPRPVITWFKNGHRVPSFSVKEFKGHSLLTFDSVHLNDQGMYWCEANSTEGWNRSSSVSLTGKWAYKVQGYCCGASVASEPQHNRNLKRTYRREYGSRIYHFLLEWIAISQSTVRLFLPDWIRPRTDLGYHTIDLFTWIQWERFNSGYVFSDLPAKRTEGDPAWRSQLFLLFLMQYVKVCKKKKRFKTSKFYTYFLAVLSPWSNSSL